MGDPQPMQVATVAEAQPRTISKLLIAVLAGALVVVGIIAISSSNSSPADTVDAASTKLYELKDARWCQGTCTDTPGWTNGHGYGCATYLDQKWCANGAAMPG